MRLTLKLQSIYVAYSISFDQTESQTKINLVIVSEIIK